VNKEIDYYKTRSVIDPTMLNELLLTFGRCGCVPKMKRRQGKTPKLPPKTDKGPLASATKRYPNISRGRDCSPLLASIQGGSSSQFVETHVEECTKDVGQ
jgi:hypothetical protein